MGNVMGLDLSLRSTGIVVLSPTKELLHASLAGQSLKRDAPIRDKIERQIGIASKVITFARQFDCAKIGIEGYAFGARGAQNDLGELQGVVKSQIWLALQIEPQSIAASSARKIVCGNGRASKERVRECLTKMGYTLNQLDLTDALAIALATFGE